jgi:hypothetical protein
MSAHATLAIEPSGPEAPRRCSLCTGRYRRGLRLRARHEPMEPARVAYAGLMTDK